MPADLTAPIEGIKLTCGIQQIGDIQEKGFDIMFIPNVYSGKIMIGFHNHTNVEETSDPKIYTDIDPNHLTEQMIYGIVGELIKQTMTTSLLFSMED